ncbi:MAG: NUDIX domain-containing protein [Oscillospiraceae bacterium]|nr:NUDIX domain-containing protein [Oscillospiraceae bacterium]
MAREEKAIFTVLCLISDENGNILVEDRKDPKWPGVSLPGGHVEPCESFTQAAIREVWEETGLTMEDSRLCGVKQFQRNEHTRYVVFLYKATKYSGTLHSSDEGEVFWIKRNELHKYLVVEDFEEHLQVFENDEINEFYYEQKDGNWNVKLF